MLADRVRPWAEKLKAIQEAGDLQHYNDRYSSLVQSIQSGDQLQPRGKVQIDIKIPHTPPPAPTVGPTPYESEKAQEDAWE